MKLFLKETVTHLSRYLIFQSFFRFLYIFQLKIFAWVFAADPCVIAIILRRRKVLEDLFPGDSDFDITCLLSGEAQAFSEGLLRCVKKYRFIKKICPVIGETKFMHEKDFFWNLTYRSSIYDKLSHENFIYKKSGFNYRLPDTHHHRNFLYRIENFLLFELFRDMYPGQSIPSPTKKFFDRSSPKHLARIKGFVSNYRDQTWVSRSYQETLPEIDLFSMTREKQNQYLDQILDAVPQAEEVKNSGEILKFEIRGAGCDHLQAQIKTLQPEILSLVSNFSSLIEDLTLFDYRPYLTSKILLIQVKDNFCWYRNDAFIQQIFKITGLLEKPLFAVGYPVILNTKLWQFVKTTDPLLNLFYDWRRFDFIQNNWITSKKPGREIDRQCIKFELIKTAELLTSMVRQENTHYMMDLLFGHILPLRILLEEGIYYGSFQSLYEECLKNLPWDKNAKYLLQLYQEGAIDPLMRVSTLSMWKTFQTLILKEIESVRNLVAS